MGKILMKGKEAIGEAAIRTGCLNYFAYPITPQKAILCVEMSMGQMIEDVERSVKGKCPVRWYGKCGGDVPTPEEVMDVILERVEIKKAA